MLPKHIVLDVDGVLANYAKAHVRIINSLWEGRLPEDFVPAGWEGYGLAKREHDKVMTQQYMTFDYWLTLEPYVENCKQLLEAYYDIPADTDLWFVTARSRTVGASTRLQTQEWLLKHAGIQNANVIVTPRSIDKPSLYAILWCKEGMASLDDYPDVVRMCEIQPRHEAFLMSQPWNVGAGCAKPVSSIKEFFTAINK
jgi:5' nucleotidase, deoxy (Pyrimidine), cytosolic type C protein (NT5C)